MSRTKKRALRVFLCHSSHDKRFIRVLNQLLKQVGVSPWLDEEQLTAGDDWEARIEQELLSTDAVIVCLSRRSTTRAGFLQREIRRAIEAAELKPEGQVFLIPIKLQPCKLPDSLSKWQCIGLYERNGYPGLVYALWKRAASLGLDVSRIKSPDDAARLFMDEDAQTLQFDERSDSIATVFKLCHEGEFATAIEGAYDHLNQTPNDHSFLYHFLYDLLETRKQFALVIDVSGRYLDSLREVSSLWAGRILKLRGLALLRQWYKSDRAVGELQEVQSVLLESIDLNPALSESHFTLALTYGLQGDLVKVDEYLAKAVKTSENAEMTVAINNIRELLQQKPEDFLTRAPHFFR
ncbi:MAG TPA: toll/interleukin-1 receptor domain-containing protein [Thermoanaerobaculia bacterium]|jgi:hypothetical protein|nr:toll/interleukin-1 receptor domain-containing protein [Thermoanaerobaculia bacterium]